jgi:hypothetical protein
MKLIWCDKLAIFLVLLMILEYALLGDRDMLHEAVTGITYIAIYYIGPVWLFLRIARLLFAPRQARRVS